MLPETRSPRRLALPPPRPEDATVSLPAPPGCKTPGDPITPRVGEAGSSTAADTLSGPAYLGRGQSSATEIAEMFFDTRWGRRIKPGLILACLFVMAVAGSAGNRWGT